MREELDVLHKTNTEKTLNNHTTSNKETPIVNSNRMKSILSEAAAAAAASGSTPTRDSANRQVNGHHKTPSSLHGQKTPSTPKPPSLSSATDYSRMNIPGSPSTEQQLPTNVNSPPGDFTQPLSVPTRLQSLNLINEAFRRFSAIKATLAAQRKQSQMTASMHRARLNSTTNNTTTKQQTNTESTIAQS